MSIRPTGDEFFSSLVSEIKNYNGTDPLRPWLQGIKKMRKCLPPCVLDEKLPRFLQKCVQTFQFERRYQNDARFIAVWIQLMDFVDDPKALLKMMEKNRVGLKQAAYYLAYALFYEKQKDFKKAEKMYELGVANLAEPASELQKAYGKFLCRKDLYEKRKSKEIQVELLSSNAVGLHLGELATRKDSQGNGVDENNLLPANKGISLHEHLQRSSKASGNISHTNHDTVSFSKDKPILKFDNSSTCLEIESGKPRVASFSKDKSQNHVNVNRQYSICSDETMVGKFVGSAIFGKSEVEDACHHGLVDPTVNMKEAINAISDMFREPLELDLKNTRKSTRRQSKLNHVSNGFEVFVDEDTEKQDDLQSQKNKDDCPGATKNGTIVGCLEKFSLPKKQMENENACLGTLTILADDDDECENHLNLLNSSVEDSKPSVVHLHACPKFKEPLPSSSKGLDTFSKEGVSAEGDTTIGGFVDSGFFEESKVENACHHGLVDPTINMKEAMDDINNMFGKPISSVRPRRTTRKSNLSCQKQANHVFSILADDCIEEKSKRQSSMDSSRESHARSDLFEPTMFTKEAMDEINSMFGEPLDF